MGKVASTFCVVWVKLGSYIFHCSLLRRMEEEACNTEEKGMIWIETATWHNDTNSKYLSLMKMLLSSVAIN